MKVSSTIRRKGKVIGKATLVSDDPVASEDAIRAVAEEARRQAKAYDMARHTARSGYRKPKKG